MDKANPYGMLDTPWHDLAAVHPRGSVVRRTLAKPTKTADLVAKKLMQRFFLAGARPRYQRIAHAWREAAHAYTTPALQRDPGTFYPGVSAPPELAEEVRLNYLPNGERIHATFVSPYQTFVSKYQATYDLNRENAVVHVRMWRHTDEARPTVVCLHGWLGGHLRLEERVFAAAQLYRSGMNVALVVLPLHGARRPRNRFDGDLFPSSDLQRTNEAFGQAVTDVRTTLAWIRREGFCTRLGLLGFSLGGYIAAIIAALESDLDFVIPLMTPASLADVVWDLVQQDAQAHADFDLSLLRQCLMVHCPLSHPPRIPRKNMMLVQGRYDGLVGSTQMRALWSHWSKPTLLTFDGSHCIHLGRQDYLRKACAFMHGGTGVQTDYG